MIANFVRYSITILIFCIMICCLPPLLLLAPSFTENHQIFIYYNDIERMNSIWRSFPKNWKNRMIINVGCSMLKKNSITSDIIQCLTFKFLIDVINCGDEKRPTFTFCTISFIYKNKFIQFTKRFIQYNRWIDLFLHRHVFTAATNVRNDWQLFLFNRYPRIYDFLGNFLAYRIGFEISYS